MAGNRTRRKFSRYFRHSRDSRPSEETCPESTFFCNHTSSRRLMVFEEIPRLQYCSCKVHVQARSSTAPEVEGGCLPGLTSSTCLSRVGTFTGSDGGLGSEVRSPRAAACAPGVRFAWCSAAGALSGAKAGAALDTTHPGPCAWGKEGSDTTPSLLQAHPSLFPHACFASAASGVRPDVRLPAHHAGRQSAWASRAPC